MKKLLLAAILLVSSAYAAYTGTTVMPPSPAASSAFGDLVTAENTPLIQLDFVYGANTQIGTLASANSGTADANSGRLRLQSGTNSAGSASYTSLRPAKYRPGQGITARFTTAFTTGVASNTQIAGMGSTVDGYFVGFNGTSFGILHRNSSSDTWVAQASWNGEALGFTLDPTKGNVWMIRYPFLGYGAIQFFVLRPTGTWCNFHTIQYPNSSVSIQLTNPNLSFYAQSLNAGSTTNLTMYVGSVGVFLNGQRFFLGPTYGTSNRKAAITTQTNVLTLKNATTYNGSTNRSLIRIKSISVAWDAGNDTAQLNVIKSTTLGGSPSYSAISGTTADSGTTITSGNSVASVDTAGTTISGGTIQFNTSVARNTSWFLDVTSFDLFLEPGATLTFAVTGDSSGAARVSVNWTEDI
jgi:hypothetical protein